MFSKRESSRSIQRHLGTFAKLELQKHPELGPWAPERTRQRMDTTVRYHVLTGMAPSRW